MATNSFLKTINLQGRKQSQEFIRALEKSKEKGEKEVRISRPVSDMSREEIRKLFDTKREEV